MAAAGGPDEVQVLAYDVAHAAAAVRTADAVLAYGRQGDVEARIACAFTADALADLASRTVGRSKEWGIGADWLAPAEQFVATYRGPDFLASLAEQQGPRHLDADFELVRETFHRFADEQIRPRAEHIHRANVHGGTEEQKQHWLPRLATAEVMGAVAVTEPDYGSDVAGVVTAAVPTEGGWLINGVKTWCTFAARADVVMLLARTDPDKSRAHRGLSLFMVEKPQADGHGFLFTQAAGSDGRPSDSTGRMEGRAIDTLGYRGMHSYEVAFENWFVPDANLVGGEGGLGRGFYLQMQGFENGRLQTAARALGVMQASYEAALD